LILGLYLPSLTDSVQRAAKKLYSRTEQVDVQAISKKLAGKYIKRAVGDAISQADKTQYHTSQMFQKQDAGDKKGANKEFKKAEEPKRKTMNRFYGVQRAASKIDKKDEEFQNHKEEMGVENERERTSSMLDCEHNILHKPLLLKMEKEIINL
jgi:hypothetical protein